MLLIDQEARVLLLRALDRVNGQTWWVTPGGGLEPGESFEEAARRELQEETGLDLQIGPWVWTRRHAYEFEGRWCDQYERFFIAITRSTDIAPQAEDHYVVEKRWWALDEIEHASQDFAPRRLGELLRPVLLGQYPLTPIDCGI